MMDADTCQVLEELQDGSMDDLQAELLLKEWSANVGGCRTHEDVMEACYAVLTAKAMPPRMGATVVAVDLMSGDVVDAGRLWGRLMGMAAAGELEETQIMNWVYGHCFRQYDAVTLARFVKLAEVAPPRERVGIAVMLGTWRGYGEAEAEVMGLIEKLGAGGVERQPGAGGA
jgi:hypothetical protein